MKTLSAAAILAGALTACTLSVDTNPDTFNVEPAMLSALSGAKPVSVENAYSAEAPHNIPVPPHTWVVEQKKLTDTAVVMMRRALEKQGLAAGPGGKSVKLRVHQPNAHVRALPFVTQVFASIVLDAELGDGTRVSVLSENQSPAGAPRAFDGAVLFALNKLLADERFVAYMRK